MSIKLPNFNDSKCVIFTACGEVQPTKEKEIPFYKTRKDMVGYYKAGRKNAFIDIMLPSSKSNLHLHIDCVLASNIQKKSIPKATHEISEIQEKIQPYLNNDIEVHITAFYKLLISELPERGLIKSLIVKEKTGDIELKLTSGSFSITGAPIHEVGWKIHESEKIVSIKIEGFKSDVLDDLYLIRLFQWMDDNFNIFVLSKSPNHA